MPRRMGPNHSGRMTSPSADAEGVTAFVRRSTMRSTPFTLIAVVAATLVIAVSGARAESGHPAEMNRKQLVFHDAMRKLWEDHVTWTRLAIVSFASENPDLPATEARLLQNQTDIGNAVKPYYGAAAGNRLTALLKDHILGAVALLQAAKAGDQTMIKQRSDEWYANANDIADFLNK